MSELTSKIAEIVSHQIYLVAFARKKALAALPGKAVMKTNSKLP